MSLTEARKSEIVDEAVAVANELQAVVAGHTATACAVAIGWVIGAVAAQGARGQIDLDELLHNVARQAQAKFDGVRDGSWPDAGRLRGRN